MSDTLKPCPFCGIHPVSLSDKEIEPVVSRVSDTLTVKPSTSSSWMFWNHSSSSKCDNKKEKCKQ